MNLYLRLVRVLIKLLYSRRIRLLQTSRIDFRVWPNDCDLNLHMNNGRFLTFMDLGRVYLMGQLGWARKLFARRWSPVIAAAEVTYLAPIQPLRKFTLSTALLAWDEKYFYIEQSFTSDGHLCAVGLVKARFLCGHQRLATADILSLQGEAVTPPQMPEVIKHWGDLNDIKRRHFSR